ncbi:alkaline phosphatase D family protein [Allokutzneria albata]|uniref:Alkaline phosphatase D n=1 Tax=Allokutzneria albata TaxID=211114 RepID=A0A1G9YXM7_ALLAB|nr:alkaline phosphatase D family protein [Allokutzneria albata]SDN13321.1 alkaline phosphatase D [Allokutzneria albata]
MREISRRSALLGGVTALGAVTLGGGATAAPANPFTLGVASGDPSPDGVVLWTRLATAPLAEDGMGGMGTRAVEVEWELADDERFTRIVRRGAETAVPELGHSVHVELDGLRPGRRYFYRFRANGHLSPAGRTRTAPAARSLTSPLTMCFASCAQYEHGYFTAYRHLAEESPDLVLHLGDYQYEYAPNVYVAPGGNVRHHVGPETTTLANYRQRYAQYKTDLDLQAAHAAAPWVVVLDDHEVENNWANLVPEHPDPGFAQRRKAAFQAYYENMPLRRSSLPTGPELRLYRRIGWGGLATFHMLDTRQYRDDQACGDGKKTCPERFNPKRTITGAAQEAWLLDGFRSSRARWDVLGQQVFFSQLDLKPGEGEKNDMDAWDGYAANRDRIVDGWTSAGVRNAVVLTGDVHAAWAGNVHKRWNDPESPSVGVELVTTSISSGGDGSETRADTEAVLKENPHIRFFNNRRGYVRTKFTPHEVLVDYRAVQKVSTPGEPVRTKASFRIVDRVPHISPRS